MLADTAGARPGQMNMMSLPISSMSRLLPERKPSPTPTKRSRDPTPHAMPNMVRNVRRRCVHSVRSVCARISKNICIPGLEPLQEDLQEAPEALDRRDLYALVGTVRVLDLGAERDHLHSVVLFADDATLQAGMHGHQRGVGAEDFLVDL